MSASLRVRISLCLQQQVKINIVANVSSFKRNGEGGQSCPLQRCQLECPHIHRNVEVWSNRENEEIINYYGHRDVFPHWSLQRICKNFINGTTLILNKHSWNYFDHDNNDEKGKTWFHEISQINVCSIIPIQPQKLEFITALYTVEFVNMWLETFDLVAGLEKLLHLACLMKCYVVILVRNWQKPRVASHRWSEETKETCWLSQIKPSSVPDAKDIQSSVAIGWMGQLL